MQFYFYDFIYHSPKLNVEAKLAIKKTVGNRLTIAINGFNENFESSTGFRGA